MTLSSPEALSMHEPLIKPEFFHIDTLGCKVNQYESDAVRGGLTRTRSFKPAMAEPPSLVIINTCSVTKKAGMQSRQLIRRAIRSYPDAVIIATGCLAQTEPEVLAEIKGIDYIIGNSHKTKIPDILGNGPVLKTKKPVIACDDIGNHRVFELSGAPATEARSRPFIKIQDGCDQFCTYCIVPYARGPSRSRPLENIADEIKTFSENGCREVVLTGIHAGRWGLDFSPPSALHRLMTHIHANDLIHRVRLSSIECIEITNLLLSFAVASERMCPHWHIPLQSGDNEILKRMNRPYSAEMFFERVMTIRELMPRAAIGTDVMVGFPGESDEAFNRTVSVLESLPVTYFHVFPFSRRNPAPAARFPFQVPPEKIKSRSKALIRLGVQKKKEFYDKMIGETVTVIVESRRDPATGLLTGISENYIRVLLGGDDRLKNRMVNCRITAPFDDHAVTAELIS
jgi:threonylcarbamoyladenosine tRNA methylthiotransferase MtaB